MSLHEANETLKKILENNVVEADAPTDVVEIKEEKTENGVVVEYETTILSTEEAQAVLDSENADSKTLAEHIYDKDEEKSKEKNEEDIAKLMQETSMPEIDKDELKIEEVVEDIEKIVNKDQTPEKVIEQITEMFIEKEEQMQVRITRLDKKNQALEKIVDELTEKNNKLKYSDTKIDVVDDYMGHFATVYKSYKETPTDEKILKNLGYISILGVQKAYPILDTEDIINLVREKKNAKMNAIQGLSQNGEKDTNIPKHIEQESRRIMPGIRLS